MSDEPVVEPEVESVDVPTGEEPAAVVPVKGTKKGVLKGADAEKARAAGEQTGKGEAEPVPLEESKNAA